ncbi:type II secretion system F family protein [Mycolicibacterium pulveris]|uniref:type II secretion system F family protein n=1 Tax=Mycolicibacterium pulveris TaxID=36813 RepID=UPI003CFAAA68
MSAAALALALALLIAPAPARHIALRRRPHRRAAMSAVAPAWPVVAALVSAVIAPLGIVVAAVTVGATVEVRRRRRVRARASAAEAVALQGALEVLVGELRVGAHPAAAFATAAQEVDGGVAASLRTVAARARMGGDVAAGLRSVAARSALSTHWERLALCWQLAQAHGLAIATLMHTAHRDVVERERFSAQVTAAMAGARTTAAVLAGLPVLGIGLGQLIGAYPLGLLCSGGAGQWLLAIGVALACAGLAWSDRITDRVLT